jgi:hypothetical protein
MEITSMQHGLDMNNGSDNGSSTHQDHVFDGSDGLQWRILNSGIGVIEFCPLAGIKILPPMKDKQEEDA